MLVRATTRTSTPPLVHRSRAPRQLRPSRTQRNGAGPSIERMHHKLADTHRSLGKLHCAVIDHEQAIEKLHRKVADIEATLSKLKDASIGQGDVTS